MACRGLWRVKSFSVTAVLTFAVGIAGTTAMFAVVDGVLLRPLPVFHQEQLVVAWKQLPSSAFDHYPFGDDDIDAVGRTSRLLQSVAGVTSNGVGRMALTEQGDASYVRVALVTERFFDVLGAHAVRGRAFAGSDGARRSDRSLVVSHAFWLRHFGGAEDVIGRRVRINEQSFTVVGVMPPGLDYPRGADAWQTTTSVPIDGPFGDAARREVDLLARTRPGVTAAQVRAELAGLIHGNEVAAPPTEPRGLLPVVQSFEDVVLGDVRRAMAVLLGAVGLVLLVACANVANLLLMRGDARRSELALRAALGAGRSGLIRQVLCESAVLACAAGGIGVAVTALSLKSLTAIIPGGLPRIDSVDLRASAVLFAIVIAFAAAFLAGLVPAIISTRRDLVSDLRSGAPALAGTGSRTGRRILVIAQLTFAVVALASATVLARSLIRVLAVKPGVEIDRVVFIDLHVPQLKYTDRARRE
ncbi:MAG: ABC transporter permease, partial [Acidobacteriota bacterium]